MGNKIYQVPFDLDDLTTAVSASKQIKDIAEEYDNALHILVNNAGANIPDRQLTKQNIEVNTGRNFVAPHKLTAELMPLLRMRPMFLTPNLSLELFSLRALVTL